MALYRAYFGIKCKQHGINGSVREVIREEETRLYRESEKLEAEYMARQDQNRIGKHFIKIEIARD